MSPVVAGALLMTASMAAFTMNDTMLKLTAGAVPLFQLIFIRSAITCTLMLATRGRIGAMHFNISRRDWGLIAARAGAEVFTSYMFLNALFNMPLANLTAILQGVPLTVTLASAFFLREAVGWRRLSAVLVGFAGVLLIVKPGAEGFNIWSLYGVLAMLGVTVRDLVTRQMSPFVPSMTVAFCTALAVATAFGLASISEHWVAIDAGTWVLIVGSAVAVMAGYFLSIGVMRVGDVSFTAPFRYTGLVWALIMGWFVFGEWPGVLTMVGATIVVATGVFTFYRERKLSAS